MPVHIGEVSSAVTVADGDMPLSPAQIDKLVKLVLQKLEQKQQEQKRNRDTSDMSSSVIPRSTEDRA